MSVRPPSVSSSEGVSPTDPNAPVMMPMSAAKKAANAASSSSASSTATASQQPGSAMRAQHSLLAESPLCGERTASGLSALSKRTSSLTSRLV